MLLETVHRGVNLHLARFDFSRSPMMEIRAKFNGLKASNFWNQADSRWCDTVDPSGQHIGGSKLSTELAGVLVQHAFDPKGARQRFSTLKKSELWNAYQGEWEVDHSFSICQTGTEQFGWIVERILSPNQVGNSSLPACKNPPSENPGSLRSLLLGVWAEFFISPDNAREKYLALKQSGYWNRKEGRWQYGPDPENITCYQLLGVLVEGLFNPKEARDSYSKLKLSKSFDAASGEWMQYGDRPQGRSDFRITCDQLLALIIEARFAEEDMRAGRAGGADAVVLPDRRRF